MLERSDSGQATTSSVVRQFVQPLGQFIGWDAQTEIELPDDGFRRHANVDQFAAAFVVGGSEIVDADTGLAHGGRNDPAGEPVKRVHHAVSPRRII